MAAGHYFAGDFSAAEEWARKAVQRGRQYYLGHVFLIAALVRLGRLDEAKRAAAEFARQIPEFATSNLEHMAFQPSDLAHVKADLGTVGIR